jgi:hypothetical protein
MSEWEVKEWHTHAVMDTRKITIKVHDSNRISHEFQREDNRSLDDLVGAIHPRFNNPHWDIVNVKRVDEKPFWIEDRGHCSFITQYDPDRDIRLSLRVRFNTLERT